MVQLDVPEGWTNAAALLRQARATRSLTIDDVTHRTRIARHHIAAIEAGRFDRCGALIYAVGFGRALARTLAADEDAVTTAIRAGWKARVPAAAPQPAKNNTSRRRIPPLGISAAASSILSAVPRRRV